MKEEATVFLVDDDPAALRALVATIKVVFPRIEVFRRPPSSWTLISRPGCLVLDVAMPGMSGMELHRKLVHDKIAFR